MLGKSQLQQMLLDMIRIRDCETKIFELFQAGQMFGLGHMSVGEEACPVGTVFALRSGDYIMSNHRGHGHAIAKGVSMEKIFAELLGKRTGTNKGLGGSLHIVDASVGDMGANGIVGANYGLAAGIAFAQKYNGGDAICVNFFGDGASNCGLFHEVMNMAVLWKLPLLLVCENNLYAVSTAIGRSTCTPTIAERAKGYGVEGITVDGNDVLAVYDAVKTAAEKARAGIPGIVELVTYRWYGHSLRVSGKGYRSEEEENAWKQKCPIKRFTKYLLQEGICMQDEITQLHAHSQAELDLALNNALTAPSLTYEEAQALVFA